jgi:hypothetical protein
VYALVVAALLSSGPREEYEKRYLHFGDFVVMTSDGPVAVMGTQPYQGKPPAPLSVPQFYRLVGENDLAQRYERRSTLKAAMAITGGVLVLGGLTTVLIAIGAQSGWAGAGGGLSVLGGLGLLTGALFIPLPYESPEVVRERADGYNEKLRRELGIEDDETLPGAKPKPPVSASLLPVVAPGFAGLAFSLQL